MSEQAAETAQVCDRGCEQGATDQDCPRRPPSGQKHLLGSGECFYADLSNSPDRPAPTTADPS